ncbi:unnamed protein product, partial [Clonostachys byssicola]
MHADLPRVLNELPPAIPREEADQSTSAQGPKKKTGLWVYMIQLSTLWGKVRTYAEQWAQRNDKMPPPWSIESEYAVIGAHLMDLETKLPARHRFDLARFPDQDSQHLQSNREYWGPWLYIQFTYHAIHSMLNHPFLYSSRPQQSAQLGVPNTFWKTSTELAFIHSTWIARLVDLVKSKEYRVSDPFIGHCTAIAATIHIYFCRAADRSTRGAAQERLSGCLAFLEELALLWPSSRWLHGRLQLLVHSAFAADQSQGRVGAEKQQITPKTISINNRLMWDILLNNFAAHRGTSTLPHAGGLFDEGSFSPPDNMDEEEDIVDMDNFHLPNVEVRIPSYGTVNPSFEDASS